MTDSIAPDAEPTLEEKLAKRRTARRALRAAKNGGLGPKARAKAAQAAPEDQAGITPAAPVQNTAPAQQIEKPKPQPAPIAQVVVRPLAAPARAKKRHRGLVFAFVAMVLLPIALSASYLYLVAKDQFASNVGFTVRSEELTSASDLLGGLTNMGGNTHDIGILYAFLHSQELVATLDAALDLSGHYSENWPADPVFAYDPDGTIEDLTDYWERMLKLSLDSGTGMMQIEVLAFDPQMAQRIAQALLDESSRIINSLSETARADATSFASDDLDKAQQRVIDAREALTAFRIANQIVDPTADIQGQMGLLNTLQTQLAEALIDYDLLLSTTREDDPRLDQMLKRVAVIEERISQERQKFSASADNAGTSQSYATVLQEFERLNADLGFAETSYTAARTAYEAALTEAQRQSRYLATFVHPTLAEQAEYPRKELIVGLVALFSFLTWAIASLVYYSLRDRR